MLHADDDNAFGAACGLGHLEIAKWLRGLCQTAEEKTAMLHADHDNAFGTACERGHLKIAKWLWKVCPMLMKSKKQCYMLKQSAMLHAYNMLLVLLVRMVI